MPKYAKTDLAGSSTSMIKRSNAGSVGKNQANSTSPTFSSSADSGFVCGHDKKAGDQRPSGIKAKNVATSNTTTEKNNFPEDGQRSYQKAMKSEAKQNGLKTSAVRFEQASVENTKPRRWQSNPYLSHGTPSASRSNTKEPNFSQNSRIPLKGKVPIKRTLQVNSRLNSRRRSTGNICQEQVWKLNGREATFTNVPRPTFVELHPNPTSLYEPKNKSLPPLNASKAQPELTVIINNRPSTVRCRQRSQSGSQSGAQDSSLGSSTRAPYPPDRRQGGRPRDKKSMSVDFGKVAFSCEVRTQKAVTCVQSATCDTARKNMLSVPTTGITALMSKRHSEGNLTTYRIRPGSGHLNPAEPSYNDTFDDMHHFSAWNNSNSSRPSSGQVNNLRARSVCSPSSAGSFEKSEALRYNFKDDLRRRFSLPNTGIYLRTENGNSPQFIAAIKELKNEDDSRPTEKRSASEHPTSSCVSSTSVNSAKDYAVTRLQRISEEIVVSPTEPVREEKNGANSETKANIESNKNGDTLHTIDENGKVTTNEKTKEQEISFLREIHDSEKDQKVSSQTQSLFHIPEPGEPFVKKLTSTLKHATEISQNEGNLHFVYGMSENNTENATSTEEYFARLGFDDHEEDDEIDLTILDEPDDDLCEEEFQRKRITLWLLSVQVQESLPNTIQATPEIVTTT
ncbi:unnamed protein product [Clavelina lepadiformis]|uniref:Uncharacterized protein n=2 Tax=Clavelina lepadiformis TaxID=159417 RepID=A0ABP0GGC3_CLALP